MKPSDYLNAEQLEDSGGPKAPPLTGWRTDHKRIVALEAVAVAAQQLATARGSGVWMAAWQDLLDALDTLAAERPA